MLVIRRSFDFADGAEKTRPLLLSFSGQRLASIQNADNQRELAYVRMDPVLLDRLSGDGSKIVFCCASIRCHKRSQYAVAGEDRDFYNHGGVSILSIGRAFLANLRAGHAVQGGSTLTSSWRKTIF